MASGWEWAKPNTIPTVGNSGYTAYYAVSDYTNYDWSSVDGYDKDNHRVERTVALTVNPATAVNVTTPTVAPVTYSADGKLSDTKLASGWEWANLNIVPTVGNSGYTAYYAVSDYTNNDWSGIDGYDKDNHRVERAVALTVNPAQVTALELSSLVTAPVKKAIPATVITGQAEYSGTVAWNDSPEKFLGNTIYTATVILTPTDNYTFNGVEENAFTYTGATDVTSTAPDASGKVTVTIVFPATDNRTVSELITSGNLTKTIYNIGEAFDPTGLTITVKYDDDTSEVITATTAGYSVSPTTMAADTTSVTVGFGGKNTSSIAVTVRENITSITAPMAIVDVANGTAKTAAALGLPTTVSIITSTGTTTTANVTWDVDSVDYDPTSLNAKNFTVNGTVELPTDMSNLNSVPLTTQMRVSVKAATLTTKPEQNTDPESTDTSEKITGIKVGGKVTVGTTLTITADEFVRGDKTYIPITWATNPSGTFTKTGGATYSTTVDTTGMTTGAHTFTITYREVETDNGAATGNTVQTVIDYTIKAVSNSDDDDGATTNYIITTDAGKGGSFDTDKTVSVKAGESASFNIKPDSGYVIADVKVDGKSVGAISYYVFTNVQANHTISAIFEAADTDVNPSTGDNSNMAWWIALLLISGGAVTVLGISKKRKYTSKH
ncbi:MAG: bacterial Ig-like domain-containing protein [Oscillospiraceae bacterium]|nr:bacterial Ig-like domain-containing protein [Oscillospiraceae bacterium]